MSVNQRDCNNNDVCLDTWLDMGQGHNDFDDYHGWQYSDSYDSWDLEYDFCANAKPSRGWSGCSRSGGKGRTKADQKDNSHDSIYSAKHVRKTECRATNVAMRRERNTQANTKNKVYKN